ncbi:MAG: hypothetical protein ACI8W7_001008, partial [Gammaproteobacteria bacterium]
MLKGVNTSRVAETLRLSAGQGSRLARRSVAIFYRCVAPWNSTRKKETPLTDELLDGRG